MCYNSPVAVERYRSGHNGADSKSVCRFTGTWVRIPPAPRELGTCIIAGAFPITRGAGWDPPVRSIYIQPPWSGVCTCFARTNLGRFRLQRLSASSIVATPHWGDCSFSDDLRIDEISATGGHRFFAPAGKTLPSFARSAKECLSQWTGILTMFHI